MPGGFSLSIARTDSTLELSAGPRQEGLTFTIALPLAPALPLDAVVSRVTASGAEAPFTVEREGDVQRPVVVTDNPFAVVFHLARSGSDVRLRHEPAEPGAVSRQPRVLRSVAGEDALRLTLEGPAGTTGVSALYTDRTPSQPEGARVVDMFSARAPSSASPSTG